MFWLMLLKHPQGHEPKAGPLQAQHGQATGQKAREVPPFLVLNLGLVSLILEGRAQESLFFVFSESSTELKI